MLEGDCAAVLEGDCAAVLEGDCAAVLEGDCAAVLEGDCAAVLEGDCARLSDPLRTVSRMPAWNPWAELRDRPQIVMVIRPLPGSVKGAYQARGTRRVIVLARSLGRQERNATLAHELVHDERGGGAAYRGQPASWDPVVARDEHQVDDEVARRLVPAAELDRLWRQARSVEGCLSPADVANAFDVPLAVASRALQVQRRRRRRPAILER